MQIPTTEEFRVYIEKFIKRTKMAPTSFGMGAVRDPNFVRKIKGGRSPSLNIAKKVNEFIEEQELGGRQ